LNAAALIQGAASGLFSAGVLITLILYFRDRKVTQAKGAVAEQTIDIQVDVDRLALLEGRMRLLNQSFDAERAVKDATIANLRADLEEERRESAAKDRKIAELVERVDSIQHDLDKVRRELSDTRRPDPTAETP
jgi:DNA repair exonuclease SbcCD ATPase subunit